MPPAAPRRRAALLALFAGALRACGAAEHEDAAQCGGAAACARELSAAAPPSAASLEGPELDFGEEETDFLQFSLLQMSLQLGVQRDGRDSDGPAAPAAPPAQLSSAAIRPEGRVESREVELVGAAAGGESAAAGSAPKSAAGLRASRNGDRQGAQMLEVQAPATFPEGSEAEDAALWQTELKVVKSAASEPAAAAAGGTGTVSAAGTPPAAAAASGGPPARAPSFAGAGLLSAAPLKLRVQLGTLAALGAVSEELHPWAGLGPSSGKDGLALLQEPPRSAPLSLAVALSRGLSSRAAESAVLFTYVSFYIVSMGALYYWMKYPLRSPKKVDPPGAKGKVVTEIDVEEEEYRRSGLSWLAIAWASPWVARWGHSFNSALTRIKAKDLPQLGRREWQAEEVANLFERFWAEEVQLHGEADASLWRVVRRVWTRPMVSYLAGLLACRIFVSHVYAVFLIEHALRYFYWLQGYIAEHGHSPNLVPPIVISICAFSSLSLLTVLFASVANSVASRLDQQLIGGLAVALFRKGQRLPSWAVTGASSTNGSPTPEDESAKDGEEAPGGAPLDLMTLVNYDVSQQLAGGLEQVCACITALVTFIILMSMLWVRLRLATFVVLACAVPTVMFSFVRSVGISTTMMALQERVDRRVAALREVLFGIRVVKCYAWEEAVEARIRGLRAAEVECLGRYYQQLGLLWGVFMSFPRMLVFSGLAGYSAIYGHQDAVTIFTCMVILGSLRAMCELFTSSLSRVVVIVPTIMRIERYLRAPEAPLIPPHKVPEWVELRPAPVQGLPSLSVRGSFAWQPDGLPALRGLNVEVQHGELVAIVGEVGAGKSTLLHAVLGELYPAESPSAPASESAKLLRPTVVVYCPQVPHIAEGTLRDNILFGKDFDEARYTAAIKAASLESDLKVLPGGDETLIGARGIMLSGGQKARVGMARAAYHSSSSLVLFDDPFGAVDAPTAKVLLQELILGPLMKDRTRLVVMQPDEERLERFDRVIIMEKGCVRAQGAPQEMKQTEAFQRLLSSQRATFQKEGGKRLAGKGERGNANKDKRIDEASPILVPALREDEHEGRPTWQMIRGYCNLGRWRNLINVMLIFCIQTFVYLLCDLVLVHWTNAMSFNSLAPDRPFLLGYLFWLVTATVVWLIGWNFGTWFTLRISSQIHDMVISRILRAPIDRFFDKHPVGRIMNRMHSDMTAVDLQLFLRFFASFAVVVQTLIPLMYIHTILPWFVTLAALPLYYMIASVCSRAWNTLTPMVYCVYSLKSFVTSRMSDVSSSNLVIRGLQDSARLSTEFADVVDESVKCTMYCLRVLKRWLVNRATFMWSFYTTTTFLVGILNAEHIGAGTLGLCLTNLLLLEALIEPNIEMTTGAIVEFVALARIHEYLGTPQEKPWTATDDEKYRNFTVKIQRRLLRQQLALAAGSPPTVLRAGAPFLAAAPDGRALVLAPGCATAGGELRPGASSAHRLSGGALPLAEVCGWHRIVAVNDVIRDAAAMAEELCGPGASDDEEVLVSVQSEWLATGVRVQIEGLVAGYADAPRDVLKGITATFEPRSKVAIAGTTGCGKSSLLLVLLRVLEPRAGRVLLNGVDSAGLGLGTLRTALGLVPQDPVLFSGTLRENLDPTGSFSDGRIRKALASVHLESLVQSWPMGLSHVIADEGGNLSFGQRQLVCLARMVLRQPALLLLDEATSAIDPNTQESIQHTLDEAFVDSTMVAVAHRLETVLRFDYAVVLDQGSVAEQGPVKELTERQGGVLRGMLEARSDW